MKIRDSFKILEEGISPIVYHGTRIENAVKIVRSNEFHLQPTFISIHEYDRKMFYMSVARSKTSDFYTLHLNNHYAVFTLDGRKLQQNVTGRAFKDHTVSTLDELEDRVLSDKNVIKNASQYIMSVDVVSNIVSKETVSIAEWCLKNRIPFRRYSNKNDMTNKRMQMSDSAGEIVKYFRVPPEKRKSDHLDISISSNERRFRLMKGIGILLSNPEANDLPPDLYSLVHNYAHQMGTLPYLGRDSLQKLSNRLRRHGIRNEEQLREFIRKRLSSKWV